MSIKLKDRLCHITGAGEGIGASLVEGFVKRDACVIASDLSAPAGNRAELNLAYDVTSPDQAEEITRKIVDCYGRLDVFIANAGVMPRQAWDEISTDDWRRIVQTNLDGAWYGAQASARVMVKQGYGKIIFVSSIEVALGVAVHCHYDSTKAALIGLTRSLARALGPRGVRVNCVMPGGVQTQIEARQFPDAAAVARQLAERQCLPHRLTPQALEPVFAFLSSSESDCITGQVVCADHGWIHW